MKREGHLAKCTLLPVTWRTHTEGMTLPTLELNNTSYSLAPTVKHSWFLEMWQLKSEVPVSSYDAEDLGHMALTPSPVPGGASAAVEPAAVWASLGPGAAAQEEGLDVQKSALLQFLPPPEDSAEGPDDSVW